MAISQAEEKLARLQASQLYPVTRLDLTQWVGDHLEEFRLRMESAPGRRKQLNHRLFARPEVPRAARRIGPEPGAVALRTEWAQILHGRTGWHGVKAGDRKTMFYLVLFFFHGVAYYVDLEGCRQATGAGDLIYALAVDWDIVPCVKPFSSFESDFMDAPVVTVCYFEVDCVASEGGVIVQAARG